MNEKKAKWFVYRRGTIVPYVADVIMRGLAHADIKNFKTRRAIYINNGEKLWWAWHKKGLETQGEKLKKELANPRLAKEHFKMFDDYLASVFDNFKEIKKLNLKKLDADELNDVMIIFFKRPLQLK